MAKSLTFGLSHKPSTLDSILSHICDALHIFHITFPSDWEKSFTGLRVISSAVRRGTDMLSWHSEDARFANQRRQSLAISLALFQFCLAQASTSQQGKSKTKEDLFWTHKSRICASELGLSENSILLWGQPSQPNNLHGSKGAHFMWWFDCPTIYTLYHPRRNIHT